MFAISNYILLADSISADNSMFATTHDSRPLKSVLNRFDYLGMYIILNITNVL